jgi:ribosomal protein S18 acetylase RimI-like enzyme
MVNFNFLLPNSQQIAKSTSYPVSKTTTTTSTLIIRHANLKDIQQMSDILTRSFHPPIGLMYWFYPLLKLGVCEDIRTRLRSSSPHYNCLVATKSGNQLSTAKQEIVGTVEISLRKAYHWYHCKQYIYIANLAVNPNYRRQGIATKLLRKCEQIAYSWGFESIYLHVLDNNNQARKLYFNNHYKIKQIESNLLNWFGNKPQRLLLEKKL